MAPSNRPHEDSGWHRSTGSACLGAVEEALPMRTEALQKCSNLAFKGALRISLVALVAWGLWATLKHGGFSAWIDTVALVVGMAVLLSLFAQDFMERCGFECSAAGLVIHRSLGNSTILYSSITRVDRVRRVASGRSERVRVTFLQGGRRRRVHLTPEDPKAFAQDVAARCPQLKHSSPVKLKRDRSFRAATEAMAPEKRSRRPTADY